MRERWWTLAGCGAWVVYCAAALSMPVLHADLGEPGFRRALVLQVWSALLGVSLLSSILLFAVRPRWPAWARVAMFAGGLLAAGAGLLLQLTSPWPMALQALSLMAISIPVGYWIGTHMERVTHLVPLAVAMSMADIYSVTGGPSRRIAQEIASRQNDVAERAVQMLRNASPDAVERAGAQAQSMVKAGVGDFLVVHLPRAGQGDTSPLLGIGDLIALAFIFRAVWVHRLPPLPVFAAALGSTIAAIVLAQSTGLPIPALPVICLGTIGSLMLFEPRLRRLDRQEVLLSIGVFALFGALLAARYIG